jgi:antitoxin HigA-1
MTSSMLVHPGEILFEEFMKPLGLSQYRVAKDICVPARRINEIVMGKRAITPDTALRLARYFGTSAQFWVNLQSTYELQKASREYEDRIEREVAPINQAHAQA